MSFADHDLTHDQFLGGRLTISQPKSGYRAGVDPVLLAAATPARPGQSVLELGCGSGVASLCLSARVDGVSVTGVELQPDYAELARRNAEHLRVDMSVVTADLRDLPSELRTRSFDHVIANPPYFQRQAGTASAEPGREIGLAGDTPLQDWMSVAAKRLHPKGGVTMIQDMRRLPDMLIASAKTDLGSIEVLPIASRAGRRPHLLLFRARKGGRAAFVMHAPLIMHEGARHMVDGESYSADVSAILRDGAALNFPK